MYFPSRLHKRGYFRIHFLLLILPFLSLSVLSQTINDGSKPNLVILFADNLAYDDVSFFQHARASDSHQREFSRTPNLDSLGRQGIKFTNWNSAAALCSASRSALLTSKYPVRTGTYPRVFRPDAKYGLLPEETTLAELVKKEGYRTSIVGKWHLGHRESYLPTNQGFDSWIGIPYHMSGGSLDDHVCNSDLNKTMWLPLYENNTIVEQPVELSNLATKYASAASNFIHMSALERKPYFLYMAFSHVHQLCAPRDMDEQRFCQWGSMENASFSSAVEEMDWIAGEIIQALDESGTANNTLVLFTSDNGPWVAEQECSGSKGPFKGEWLKENADTSCTACPHDYVPNPTTDQPHRCVLAGTKLETDGVACGDDTGLGSVWEANLRMPALARFPGKIVPGTESNAMISTLDVLPTFLSLLQTPVPEDIDGRDVSKIMFGEDEDFEDARPLFFWRDGFKDGPLPQPYGRFDVAAMKLGRIKAWFWTKSAHYNDDVEQFHDPPLLFDVISDPAESKPLDPANFQGTILQIKELTKQHKDSVDWSQPLALDGDPRYIPCADRLNECRTHRNVESN